MAQYTAADIDKLREQGVLTNKDANWLKQDLIEQNSQEEGLVRKFLGNLSQQFTDEWTGAKQASATLKPADISSHIEVMAGTLDAVYKIAAAATQTVLGEPTYSFLVKMGVNKNVANYVAAYADMAGQFVATGGAVKAVEKAIPANVKTAMKQALEKSLGVTTQQKIEAAGKETLSKAAQVLKKGEEQAAAKVANIQKVNDLLDEAAKAVRGEASMASSTSKTLEAAYQTSLGKKPAEAIAEEIVRRPEVKAANRGLNAIATPKVGASVEYQSGFPPRTIRGEVTKITIDPVTKEKVPWIKVGEGKEQPAAEFAQTGKVVRGGAPMAAEEAGATARARAAFEEGAAKYEASKINMKELHGEAQKKEMSLAEVINLKREPKTPLEVAEISQPIRQSGEQFIKLRDEAEAALEKGDFAPFHRMMAEWNFQVKAHWPYMAPRQLAGQTLTTYNEPVLSATQYLQQIPGLSSWLGKLKINTVDEMEANAGTIIREMKKVKSPHEIATYAKSAAETMAEGGDEVLSNPTFRDKAHYFFVNSLMSSSDTIGKNFSGNMVNAPWHWATKQTSITAAKIMNPFLSAEHHIQNGYYKEANVFVTTWAKGLFDGGRYAMRNQYDDLYGLLPDKEALTALMSTRYDLKRYATTGTSNPFTGMKGTVIGTPVTIAQAADEVSRIAFYRAGVAEQMAHEWIRTGSKLPFPQYLEEGFKHVPPSMHDYGIRMAMEGTWSDKLSVFGRGISSFRSIIPGTEFIQPFVRTMDRLLSGIYNHAPVLSMASTRTWTDLTSGDPIRRGETIGRMLWTNIVSAGLFMGMGTKAPDGMNFITGGGPTDRELATFQREHKLHLPYTLWTPAGRFSYHGYQPASGPLGMIADAREIWDEIEEPNAEIYWSGIQLALARNFFDNSFTKQWSDVLSIWDDPSRGSSGWSRLAANLVKGFVEPAVFRQALRAYDPTLREVDDFRGELSRDIAGFGIPGLDPPAKRNKITGEPITHPPRMFQNVPILGWISPTSPMQPASDAFSNKIKELRIKLPDFYRSYGGRTPSEAPFAYQGPLGEAKQAEAGLPLEERYRQQGMDYMNDTAMFGSTLQQEGEKMVSDPEFNKLAPIDQAENIMGLYNSRMSAARTRVLDENPVLLEALDLKLQKRAEVRMPPEERDAFTRTIEPPQQEMPVQFIPFESPTEANP